MLLSITPYNLDGTPDMFVITVANYTSNITSFSTGLFLVLYVLVWRHLLAYDEWLPTSLLLWFLSSRIRLFSFWYLSSENLSVYCILTFRIYFPYFWTNRIALFLSTKWSLHCPFGWVATTSKRTKLPWRIFAPPKIPWFPCFVPAFNSALCLSLYT